MNSRHDPEPQVEEIAKKPKRAKDFQLTLTRALLASLELRRTLYAILSGTTAGDGLDFNRAFLFLADEGQRVLRGQLAIGPASPEEADRIWRALEALHFDLAQVMERYDAFAHDAQAAELSTWFERVTYPLPLVATPEEDPFHPLLRRAFQERQPLVVNDLPLPLPGTSLVLVNFALAPLAIADRTVGLLVVDNAWNGRPIEDAELDDLVSVANLAAVAVERARLYERIRQMADVDGLTGLLNRRRLDEIFPDLVAACRRHGEPLAVLLVDVDHFKSWNDRLGHLIGDDLLRGIAEAIRARLRQSDAACRYGGDEVVIVLPRTGGVEAMRVAEHVRVAVRALSPGSSEVDPPSVSIGVAELRDRHTGPSDLLADADQALYAAKEAGRNRAVLHPG
jgi:diguanylate cyclase (GGDEF)-like protein